MGLRWMLLLWMLTPLLLGLSAEGKTMQKWTVERFSGTLSGQTATVTRKLWAEGALAGDGQGGSLRSEAVFALRSLQAEMPERTWALEQGTGYTAEAVPQDLETGEWLMKNAWRFGLIAEGSGDRVRLRCVGPTHAAAMHALGADLNGYLAFLRKTGQAELRLNGRTVAWIFCLPAGEAVSFTLPEGAAWEISGDGAGNVIIAVRSGS